MTSRSILTDLVENRQMLGLKAIIYIFVDFGTQIIHVHLTCVTVQEIPKPLFFYRFSLSFVPRVVLYSEMEPINEDSSLIIFICPCLNSTQQGKRTVFQEPYSSFRGPFERNFCKRTNLEVQGGPNGSWSIHLCNVNKLRDNLILFFTMEP